MSGGAARHPNSLANLRRPWRTGESGNPRGRPKGRHSPERKLRKLFEAGLEDRAEQMLSAGVAMFRPWAWDLLWPPAPRVWVDPKTGEEIEPAWVALPPSLAWTRFAKDLQTFAARHPYRIPSKLRAAVRARR